MNKKIILASIPLILWMSLIFFFSDQNSSNSGNISESGIKKVITIIINIKDQAETESKVDAMILVLNPSVRKVGHAIEYFVLGLLMINLFIKLPIHFKKAILYSIILTMFYAASDEFHQLFISGRSGELKDILLDSMSGTLGIMAYVKLYSKRTKE